MCIYIFVLWNKSLSNIIICGPTRINGFGDIYVHMDEFILETYSPWVILLIFFTLLFTYLDKYKFSFQFRENYNRKIKINHDIFLSWHIKPLWYSNLNCSFIWITVGFSIWFLIFISIPTYSHRTAPIYAKWTPSCGA